MNDGPNPVGGTEEERAIGAVSGARGDRTIPLTTDGRDVDPRLGRLAGAGAGQVAAPTGPDRPMPGAGETVWDRVPSAVDPDALPTYYDQPIVKAPPWGPVIPAYLVLGGASGAAAALAAATARVPELRSLTTAATWLAAGTGGVGSVLLLTDLGRPERALNMLRVARPTSPMSMGVYLLSGTVGAASVAALLGNRRGVLGWTGRRARTAAGLLGLGLSGYTGVLLGTTALPGWNLGLHTLPPLFVASGAATTGSVLTPVTGGATAVAVDTFRVVAQLGELAAEQAHERAIGGVASVQAVYRQQRGWRIGRWLTLASLAATLVPVLRRRRWGRVLIGALGLAGSVATKVAVFDAGMATAADPRTTVEQQRP